MVLYKVNTGCRDSTPDERHGLAQCVLLRTGRKVHGVHAHPGFARLRVHDLKHTFGRRLRAGLR